MILVFLILMGPCMTAGAFLYNHKLLLKFNHKIMQIESKGVTKDYSEPRIVPGAGMAGGILPGDSQTTITRERP